MKMYKQLNKLKKCFLTLKIFSEMYYGEIKRQWISLESLEWLKWKDENNFLKH
jgi:hypothetical protein